MPCVDHPHGAAVAIFVVLVVFTGVLLSVGVSAGRGPAEYRSRREPPDPKPEPAEEPKS